jgi:hypothetical protein
VVDELMVGVERRGNRNGCEEEVDNEEGVTNG